MARRPVQMDGEIVQGFNGVHHWWANHGSEPEVLISVGVTKT